MVVIKKNNQGKEASMYPKLLKFSAVVVVLIIFSHVRFGPVSLEDDMSRSNNELKGKEITAGSKKEDKKAVVSIDYQPKIAYGTRGGGEHTSLFIKDAILNGFRHVVTSGHHNTHNESGVGEGWKMAVEANPSIKRSDLYLQTMFVPWGTSDFKAETDDPKETPETIEEQVHLSLKQSLKNLQADYIDAVLFNNNKAKLHPYDEMLKAWKVLEEYVKNGTIRFLGLTSVHDAAYLKRLYNEATVKPRIIQNRFHANRQFDVNMRSTFRELNIHVQRFWVLTGNGGGHRNAETARQKGVSKEQLMLAFIMSLGDTPLVGTHQVQHMKDDLEIANGSWNELFKDIDGEDKDRKSYADNLKMNFDLNQS